MAINLTLVGLPGDTSELYIDAAGLLRREQPGSQLYEAALQEVRNMERTILGVLEDRRRAPRNDVATVVAHIEVDGEPAPFDLLHNLLETLVSGGVSTTVSLIAHALQWLPTQPTERLALVDDEQLFAKAILEYLRLATPASNFGRRACRAAEIAGRRIEVGEQLMLSYAAANRDPHVFPDPDTARFDRDNGDKHLSFGIGRHRCIGMHLGIATARTVVERIVRRVPDFEVQGVERYARMPNVNGVLGLPVTFSSGAPVGATRPAEGPALPDRVVI